MSVNRENFPDASVVAEAARLSGGLPGTGPSMTDAPATGWPLCVNVPEAVTKPGNRGVRSHPHKVNPMTESNVIKQQNFFMTMNLLVVIL
jgi:hypothetical protein